MSEQEQLIAAAFMDTMWIFSADSTFRLILPSSLSEIFNEQSSSEALFNMTNGTWAFIGPGTDGNARYSLTVPAFAEFGVPSIGLKIVNGFIVLGDSDDFSEFAEVRLKKID
jgi:hypothetical protein